MSGYSTLGAPYRPHSRQRVRVTQTVQRAYLETCLSNPGK